MMIFIHWFSISKRLTFEKFFIFSPKMVDGLDIFNFNHISKDLPEELEETLKEFYKFYRKAWWCHNNAFKRYKRKSLSLTILSTGSIISGAAAGGVTLNPIIIGVLTSVGIIVKVLSNFKKYEKKVESTRYAATTYAKVLDELRMHLRGGKQMYNHEDYVKSMKIIDDAIVDNCPEVEAYWGMKYEKRISSAAEVENEEEEEEEEEEKEETFI